jgi:CHAT domain-containing protein
VLAALDHHSVMHFACHGTIDFIEPGESALLMGDDEPITVRDLLERRLGGTELVVLSACETAVQGLTLPDEAISLTTGLIQAGSAGVVGSLWAVPDDSTFELMRHFYEAWPATGRPAPRVLAEAQGAVRDSDRRYSHPVYWAAFAFFGVARDLQSTEGGRS